MESPFLEILITNLTWLWESALGDPPLTGWSWTWCSPEMPSKDSLILYNAAESRALPATDEETPSCCSLREKEHSRALRVQ